MTKKDDEAKLEKLNIDAIQEVKVSKIKYIYTVIFFIIWVIAFKILENSELSIVYLLIILLVLIIAFIFLYVLFVNYLNSSPIVCNICKEKMRKIGEKSKYNIFICPNKHLIKTRKLAPSLFHGGFSIKGL